MAEAPVDPPKPITHRRVLKIAVPIVLANITVPVLGAVDTGVVGQMGQAAPIAAVGVGAVIISAAYFIFGFLRAGTTGLTSQAVGAGDGAEVAALLSRGMMIALVGSALVMAFQLPIMTLGFRASPASAEVEGLARDYITIRIFSAPAAVGMYAITGWLIAQERTGAVLAIQAWMNVLNIVLDLWFVLGLGWGVEGVAFATFLAEWSGLALGLWFCRGALRSPAMRDWARVFDPDRLLRFGQVSGDIFLRGLAIEAIFISFLLTGGRFGDVPLAANQILLQFLHVTAFAMDGFAFAAEALVGNAMGRRSRARVRRASVMSSIWGGVIVVLLSLAFALAGGQIIDLMTTAPEVRSEARIYLAYMVFAPLLGGAAWMLDGIFIGATRTADMRNMMLLSALIYGVTALALVPSFGNHGLWIALLVSFVARGVTLGVRYPALERSAEG